MIHNPIIVRKIVSSTTPIGSKLMKTGQTTSYRTGDDGDIEAGRNDSFTILLGNNPFGNTNRFTDELGGQTYTNGIVIDWSTFDGSTVLGIPKNVAVSGNSNWNNAVDFCNSFSIGLFSGWRLWNIKEAINFISYEGTYTHFWYPPFNNSIPVAFWTSNTLPIVTTYAYALPASYYQILISAKTELAGRAMPVRNFTVTGTTLT